jgi:phenylpropionate dioxygenase-like ring-hydroxylating dioxygenase large terminal subunit
LLHRCDFYEFEKTALFDREWLCVDRAEWVKEPGDYFTTEMVGEPLVIDRMRDGKISALSSVCQHRGFLVAEGKGSVRGFVCPYYHWVYGLDGHLVNAPAMEQTCDFDKEDVRAASGFPWRLSAFLMKVTSAALSRVLLA